MKEQIFVTQIFYLTFVDYLHPKGRRRFPKGDRKALGKQHKRTETRGCTPEGVQRATAKPLGSSVNEQKQGDAPRRVPRATAKPLGSSVNEQKQGDAPLRARLRLKAFFHVRLRRGLSGRSATSIVASYACSFRLMRSRLLYAPLAHSRSLTPAPLRVHPLEGSLWLKEQIFVTQIFYLTFVDYLHPKGRRRFPKGDRKALGKQHKRTETRGCTPEGVQRATGKPSGSSVNEQKQGDAPRRVPRVSERLCASGA